MKTQQQAMLADLQRCWMSHTAMQWVAQMQAVVERYPDERISKSVAGFIRRLWNRYRNQIRHNNKKGR